MHISTKETEEKASRNPLQEFADYFPNINFKNINTSYRDIITPTVRYVMKDFKKPRKNYTTVLVPNLSSLTKPWQISPPQIK